MSSTNNSRKWLAIWLGILQIFICIGAVPYGIAMIADPSGSSVGMSIDMLINSPFSNFLIPGIFLLVVNGTGSLLGVVASFLRYRFAGEVAIGLGTFLIFWILAQVWWMGVHWLHILYIIFGIAELVLGLMCRKLRKH